MKKMLLMSAVFFAAYLSANAQCTTASLDVSTGHYNGGYISLGSSDPLWYCVGKTGDFVGGLPAVGSNAEVVYNSGWAGSGIFLCDNATDANPGIITNQDSRLTFERRFNLCSDDVVTFNISIVSDGFVDEFSIDGVPTSFVQTTSNWNTGIPWYPGGGTYSVPLSAGAHTFSVRLYEPAQYSSDPVGFTLNGNLTTSGGATIVDDQQLACAGYDCSNPPAQCDDQCYWTVVGNHITPGRNLFGTLTDDDIRITTNGSSVPNRGIITKGNALTGGYLGWNTLTPTARLHVNCINGNNPKQNFAAGSDIRFEHLEPGTGNILVIDQQGYVYESQVPIDNVPHRDAPGNSGNLQEQIRDLKIELAELRTALTNGSSVRMPIKSNTLYQNAPNPFSQSTVINYGITSMQRSAMIAIYDLNGKELQKHTIENIGEGNVTISANSLASGMYLYSLIIDGQEIDTKRMVLSK